MLKDVGVPVAVAAVAVLWPWLLALQRGWRFRRLIRRELEEVGPHPPEPEEGKPWWEHATKRFVHEEIFSRSGVSAHRDFVLSLDATLVYQVSQLWIALEKRDGDQWTHCLSELTSNRRVTSRKLKIAADHWKAILDKQPQRWRKTMGVPTSYRQGAALQRVAPLFEQRAESYGRLLPHLDLGPPQTPKRLTVAEREALGNRLRGWFYDGVSGLLLSGRAHEQFVKLEDLLGEADVDPETIWAAASRLRTDLKVDLGVRQPQESRVAMSWPEDERW